MNGDNSQMSLGDTTSRTSVFQMVAVAICAGFMLWVQGIKIYPVRITEAISVGPILIAMLCKSKWPRAYWFLWGMAIGGFLMHILLVKYLVAGANP